MLAEWLTRRVEFSFGGRAWPLLFTHRALLLAERTTGIDTLSANLADPTASLLRGLLFAALSVAGAECSLAQAGRCLSKLEEVRDTIVSAWLASMPDANRPRKIQPREIEQEPATPTWPGAWAEATSKYGLGLTDEQWLDMTPRQVQELQDLRIDHLQREELMMGILAATIENFSACHPKRPVSAEAFMLHKFPQKEQAIGDQIMGEMSRLTRQG